MQPGLLEGLLHGQALPGMQGHGFFHAAMLAGGGHLQAVGVMAVGRRGDVHRVHLGVVDQGLGIGVPAGNAVALCIVAHRLGPAAHHRHQRRPRNLVEGRATLALGDTAATDHAPAHGLQRLGPGVHFDACSARRSSWPLCSGGHQ